MDEDRAQFVLSIRAVRPELFELLFMRFGLGASTLQLDADMLLLAFEVFA